MRCSPTWGGATQANAGLYKNDAAIKKTEASNQWNFYQAKSSKQNLAELAVELAPDTRKAFYAEEVKRYNVEKKEIKTVAEKFEAESKDWDKKSEEQLHQHHRWAQATTALQIAIAMAAIAWRTVGPGPDHSEPERGGHPADRRPPRRVARSGR